MKTPLKNIDWLNHSISFFSALMGIFIAFQLQDYQDDVQEQEKLKITLEAIKQEVAKNQLIYKNNAEFLTDFLVYINLMKNAEPGGNVKVNKAWFEKMNNQAPARFKIWKLIEELNDSTLVFQVPPNEFVIDILPQTGISTNSWQAGLYSGILNRLDHTRLEKLTYVYDWISKDMGVNESEFYEKQLYGEFSDITNLLEYYNRVAKSQGLKLRMIQGKLDEMTWD